MNIPASILKRVESIVNNTNLTDANEIIKLAIQQENELINEMLTKKTAKSKEAWEVVMKKVYCNQILRTI